jgi:hypothetical protein
MKAKHEAAEALKRQKKEEKARQKERQVFEAKERAEQEAREKEEALAREKVSGKGEKGGRQGRRVAIVSRFAAQDLGERFDVCPCDQRVAIHRQIA